MVDGLRRAAAAIDWRAPWFAAVRAVGAAVAANADPRTALNAAACRAGLRNAAGRPLRFGPAAAAGASAYEAHIARTGEVPTRDNLHDLFNALVWLAFPRTKARLNALQARAIAADGIGARRGSVRDAATLIDENAVLLVTQRADLIAALRAHDWQRLFVAERGAWQGALRAIVFGHALMEKLVQPYKAVTAHALVLDLPADADDAAVDGAAAAALGTDLTPRALAPLPVLGIPGWADNGSPAFYDDAAVFRPARRPAHDRPTMRIHGRDAGTAPRGEA